MLNVHGVLTNFSFETAYQVIAGTPPRVVRCKVDIVLWFSKVHHNVLIFIIGIQKSQITAICLFVRPVLWANEKLFLSCGPEKCISNCPTNYMSGESMYDHLLASHTNVRGFSGNSDTVGVTACLGSLSWVRRRDIVFPKAMQCKRQPKATNNK